MIVFSTETLTAHRTPQALALTHALTLGFLVMTMLGAQLQMLSVVAGAPCPPRAWLPGSVTLRSRWEASP